MTIYVLWNSDTDEPQPRYTSMINPKTGKPKRLLVYDNKPVGKRNTIKLVREVLYEDEKWKHDIDIHGVKALINIKRKRFELFLDVWGTYDCRYIRFRFVGNEEEFMIWKLEYGGNDGIKTINTETLTLKEFLINEYDN